MEEGSSAEIIGLKPLAYPMRRVTALASIDSAVKGVLLGRS
jgi:hypothetical protein